MSKIVKLSRIAVVLFTLFVLGSMTALPVAYADGNKPDAAKYCSDRGYPAVIGIGGMEVPGREPFQCTSGSLTDHSGPIFDLNTVCAAQYPGTHYDPTSDSCKN